MTKFLLLAVAFVLIGIGVTEAAQPSLAQKTQAIISNPNLVTVEEINGQNHWVYDSGILRIEKPITRIIEEHIPVRVICNGVHVATLYGEVWENGKAPKGQCKRAINWVYRENF